MIISEQVRDNVRVLELKGVFMGEPESSAFQKKKYQLLEENHVNIVLDLSGLTMINSSGLGSMISALVSIRNKGGDLRLARASESIDYVIHKVQLEKVFRVFRSVEEAVSSFGTEI